MSKYYSVPDWLVIQNKIVDQIAYHKPKEDVKVSVILFTAIPQSQYKHAHGPYFSGIV